MTNFLVSYLLSFFHGSLENFENNLKNLKKKKQVSGNSRETFYYSTNPISLSFLQEKKSIYDRWNKTQ